MTAVDLAAQLPEPTVLRDRCRALAMLEAIVSPEWESRYYSFDAAWGEREELASMRNGSGDEYSIVFSPVGVFIRGFDHESPMSPGAEDELWPGLLDGLPAAFRAIVNEPAFSYDGILNATFVIWRAAGDDRWRTGEVEFPRYGAYREDPDGSGLLKILCAPGPEAYLEFAVDYYERALDPAAATHVWQLRPLDEATVIALNPELSPDDLTDDRQTIGYPPA